MRRNYHLFILLFPVVFWLVCFFLLPLVSVFIYSFIERGTYGGVRWHFTWENYQRLFDGLYLGILWRSVSTALVCTAVCLLLGYPFAYYLARYKPKHRNVLLLLVVVPFWTNFLISDLRVDPDTANRRTPEQSLGSRPPELESVRTPEYATCCPNRARLRIPTLHDTPTLCCFGAIGCVAVRSRTRLRGIATPGVLAHNRAAEFAGYPCGFDAGFHSDGRCVSNARPPRWWKSELYRERH